MTPEGEYYDPEKDARPSSPGLAPTQISYKPEESPPPYIPTSSSSSSSSPCVSPGPAEGKGGQQGLESSAFLSGKKNPKRKRRKKGRTRPSQGDAVLISYLDPNRPDIAREFAQRALNSASQSEAEDDLERDMNGDGKGEHNGRTQDNHQNSARATELKTTAWAALNDVMAGDGAPERNVLSASLTMHGVVQKQGSSNGSVVQCSSLHGNQDSKTPLRSLNPALPLKIRPPSEGEEDEGEDESIATSPALAKFAISAAEANPDSTLPAMQKSPPRSASTHSPDGTQSLPSLRTTLSQIADTPIVETPSGVSPFSQNSVQSPNLARSHHVAGNPGPSPSMYSNPSPASLKDITSMSPPSYPTHSSHSSHWWSTPKEGSFSTASPASAPGLTSVASYPTPKDIVSPESSTSPQTLNGTLSASEPFTSTAFKCTHPGCTALPFQTQYLLNSHANVHSSSRPHYCPITTCPRSSGGKGFKRKNEMIRHGLVHESPGYVCPFCADQQHKYPRPDNLQR